MICLTAILASVPPLPAAEMRSDGVAPRKAAATDVRDFGVQGDGTTLVTAALQAAIDACPPGSVLRVGPGKYVIGTIKLKSDFELHLAAGAELLGSTSIGDYARDNQGAIEAPAFDECVVYAENASNIKISGEGMINGRGTKENFPEKIGEELADRPMLIRFVNCQNVTFTGVTLKNSASWCTHMVNCENLIFRKVTIDSHVNINNDGFDLDGCKNILIEDCNIHSGDDSICPKSTTERFTENMVVRNCRAISHTSAFKCGTSSRGGFRNITVTDCDFSDTRMGVIKLMIVDGGLLENIRVSNIVANNVEGPIFIRLGNRGRSYAAPTEQVYDSKVKAEGLPPGIVRNIRISNIQATVVSDMQDRCGIMISGIPDHFVEDVVLENINISYPGGGGEELTRQVIPEDEARYPEPFFFGTLPSWGAFVRHARNIQFKNVTMEVRSPDQRQKIVMDDVVRFVEN